MHWLLIVTTTFFAHGSHDPTIVTFQEFNTQKRCEEMRDWVNKTYYDPTRATTNNNTYAQCVPKD